MSESVPKTNPGVTITVSPPQHAEVRRPTIEVVCANCGSVGAQCYHGWGQSLAQLRIG